MLFTARSFAVSLTAIVTGLSPVHMHRRHQADARAALLVTPRWVQEHLKDPKLVLLHVGTKPEYDEKHLPGALFVQLQDIAAPRDTSANARALELPSVEELRKGLERFGISDDSRIIVYYGNDWVSPSTRVVLTLEYAGLGTATSVLDGGMPAWTAEGFATTKDVPSPRSGKLSALRTKPVTVTGEWVRDNATKPGYALIDARSASFYDGVQEGGTQTIHRKGHIPGAHSIPFDFVWTDKNQLKSQAELSDIFAKAGVKPGDTVVGYCHVGQQATAMLFAARALGHKVLLYDGSFEDWAIRDWPVEVNPKAGKH